MYSLGMDFESYLFESIFFGHLILAFLILYFYMGLVSVQGHPEAPVYFSLL